MSRKSRQEILEDARRARLAAENEPIVPMVRRVVPAALAEFIDEAEVFGAPDQWWRSEMRKAVPEEYIDELYERIRPFLDEITKWKERGDEESSYEKSCFVCLSIFVAEA